MRSNVYYNLHKKCYSVREQGLVADHVDSIVLKDCRFNVAPAGQAKVRRTGVKNVHATVSGIIRFQMEKYFEEYGDFESITYNPFKYDTFVRLLWLYEDSPPIVEPVHGANHVLLLPNREIRAWGIR